MIRVAEEISGAAAVVALETTLVAHGFPPGEGVEVGLESERQVRAAGAVPATVGVLDGEVRVGLTEEELGRFDVSARKAGPRDLGAAAAQGVVAATTVGGTLAVARVQGLEPARDVQLVRANGRAETRIAQEFVAFARERLP